MINKGYKASTRILTAKRKIKNEANVVKFDCGKKIKVVSSVIILKPITLVVIKNGIIFLVLNNWKIIYLKINLLISNGSITCNL